MTLEKWLTVPEFVMPRLVKSAHFHSWQGTTGDSPKPHLVDDVCVKIQGIRDEDGADEITER